MKKLIDIKHLRNIFESPTALDLFIENIFDRIMADAKEVGISKQRLVEFLDPFEGEFYQVMDLEFDERLEEM